MLLRLMLLSLSSLSFNLETKEFYSDGQSEDVAPFEKYKTLLQEQIILPLGCSQIGYSTYRELLLCIRQDSSTLDIYNGFTHELIYQELLPENSKPVKFMFSVPKLFVICKNPNRLFVYDIYYYFFITYQSTIKLDHEPVGIKMKSRSVGYLAVFSKYTYIVYSYHSGEGQEPLQKAFKDQFNSSYISDVTFSGDYFAISLYNDPNGGGEASEQFAIQIKDLDGKTNSTKNLTWKFEKMDFAMDNHSIVATVDQTMAHVYLENIEDVSKTLLSSQVEQMFADDTGQYFAASVNTESHQQFHIFRFVPVDNTTSKAIEKFSLEKAIKGQYFALGSKGASFVIASNLVSEIDVQIDEHAKKDQKNVTLQSTNLTEYALCEIGYSFYYNSTENTTTCQKCQDQHCRKCYPSNWCGECFPTYYVHHQGYYDDPQCRKCSSFIEQCYMCSTSYDNAKGQFIINCTECEKQHKVYVNKQCICDTYYILNEKTSECDACDPYLRCKTCEDQRTCTLCDASKNYNELPVNGKCHCKKGYWEDSTLHTCVTCEVSGCFDCSQNHTVCQKCDTSSGFIENPIHNSTLCQCQDSESYDDNGLCTKCSAAMEGCLKCQNSSQCQSCNQNGHFVANSTDNKCMCMDHYVLSEGSCVLCSNHIAACIECESTDDCLECNRTANFMPNPNAKTGNCECLQGYFKRINNQGECFSCQTFVPYCRVCSQSSENDADNEVSCVECQKTFWKSDEDVCICPQGTELKDGQCATQSPDNDWIIYAAIGAGAFLIVTVIVICCCCKKCRKKDQNQEQRNPLLSHASSEKINDEFIVQRSDQVDEDSARSLLTSKSSLKEYHQWKGSVSSIDHRESSENHSFLKKNRSDIKQAANNQKQGPSYFGRASLSHDNESQGLPSRHSVNMRKGVSDIRDSVSDSKRDSLSFKRDSYRHGERQSRKIEVLDITEYADRSEINRKRVIPNRIQSDLRQEKPSKVEILKVECLDEPGKDKQKQKQAAKSKPRKQGKKMSTINDAEAHAIGLYKDSVADGQFDFDPRQSRK